MEKTRKQYFEEIKGILIELDKQDLINFVDKQIEQLNKKSSKGVSEQEQKTRNKLAEILVQELAKVNKNIMVTELLNNSEVLKNYKLENGMNLTSQKVTPILTKLVNDGRIVNTKDKKKSFYCIAKENTQED